jgi:hypothetical protein
MALNIARNNVFRKIKATGNPPIAPMASFPNWVREKYPDFIEAFEAQVAFNGELIEYIRRIEDALTSAKSEESESEAGEAVAPVTITSTTVLSSANETVLVDASSGAVSVVLPNPGTSGQIYNIKKIAGANTVSLLPNDTETIDGEVSWEISLMSTITVLSDGSNWYIL